MTSPARQPGHTHAPWLGRLLDLDAEIHAGMLTAATALVAGFAGGSGQVRRVLDVGAGTGTGTVALARRFPAAEVVAVDADEHMLEQVRARARAAGLDRSITTVHTDVSAEQASLGPAGLVWSSAALHEVSRPERAFRNLFDALVPGGLLAVMEMDAPPRVLPDRLAAFEDRVRDGAGASPAASHPDWTAAIEAAGFVMVSTRQLTTDQTLPAAGPAGEYAALELRRMGHHAMPALAGPDRAALVTLAGEGPGSVRSLDELRVRGTRTVWVARRP